MQKNGLKNHLESWQQASGQECHVAVKRIYWEAPRAINPASTKQKWLNIEPENKTNYELEA